MAFGFAGDRLSDRRIEKTVPFRGAWTLCAPDDPLVLAAPFSRSSDHSMKLRPDVPLTLHIQRIELLQFADPTQSEASDRSEATAVPSGGEREG